jgi:hypothetical protein
VNLFCADWKLLPCRIDGICGICLSVFFPLLRLQGCCLRCFFSAVWWTAVVRPAICGLASGFFVCFLLIKVLLSSLLSCMCVVLDCLVSALMHDVRVQLVYSVWCMDSKLETYKTLYLGWLKKPASCWRLVRTCELQSGYRWAGKQINYLFFNRFFQILRLLVTYPANVQYDMAWLSWVVYGHSLLGILLADYTILIWNTGRTTPSNINFQFPFYPCQIWIPDLVWYIFYL